MFLRKNRRRIEGETYEYWTLCESVRTERGPRQRVVATLGKLDDDDLRAGWDQIEEILDGRQPGPRQPELPNGTPEAPPPPGAWELADLSRIEVGRVREFGSVFLGLALWRRLGLHELLDSLIEPGREEVAWADVAAVLTVGKFCGQASELGIAGLWYARTALEDIAGIPADAVNDDRLCRALDKVGAHKDRLCAYEAELAEKERWGEVQPGVGGRLVPHPDCDGQERLVLCRSKARGAKERAMGGQLSGGVELGAVVGVGGVLGEGSLGDLHGRGGDLGVPVVEALGLDAELCGDDMGGLAAVVPAADGVLPEGLVVLGLGDALDGWRSRGSDGDRTRDGLGTGGTFRPHDADAVFVSDSLSSESRQPHARFCGRSREAGFPTPKELFPTAELGLGWRRPQGIRHGIA